MIRYGVGLIVGAMVGSFAPITTWRFWAAWLAAVVTFGLLDFLLDVSGAPRRRWS